MRVHQHLHSITPHHIITLVQYLCSMSIQNLNLRCLQNLSLSEIIQQNESSTHLMLTRLKSAAIEMRNYAALVAFCPELQSLQIINE